jgi:hypothetical protein
MGIGRTSVDGGDVSPKLGRKSKLTQSPLKSEAHAVPLCQRWVVHKREGTGQKSLKVPREGDARESKGSEVSFSSFVYRVALNPLVSL